MSCCPLTGLWVLQMAFFSRARVRDHAVSMPLYAHQTFPSTELLLALAPTGNGERRGLPGRIAPEIGQGLVDLANHCTNRFSVVS